MSKQAHDHEPAGNGAKTAALMREVRLGLVCYGGVSLAIYMHGVTKEIYKLVRAARAFERAYAANGYTATGTEDPDQWLGEGPGYDSERAYFAAFAALAANGTPLTVTVDIIAGTSAGGINGVCLARGLAEGRSLDGFRNLWLVDADMENLLAGHALIPFGPARMLSKLAESAARLAWHRDEGLLNGDLMSRLLYQALDGMQPAGNSLVPADESLDLFVTTTNVYGYETAIPTGAGGMSHTDRSYRQLLRFHHGQAAAPGQAAAAGQAPAAAGQAPAAAGQATAAGQAPAAAGQATAVGQAPAAVGQATAAAAAARFGTGFGDVPALAFAARATASFPGAFPPVSLGTFVDALDKLRLPPDPGAAGRIARHFVYGLDYGATGDGQWFMDGGVLDNGPFDPVIDAIAAKRADGPTAREIIYIEPDPGPPPPRDQHAPDPEPTLEKTVWASRITIPQHTPLVGVLGQLEAMNAAIGEVGAIVRAQEPAVLAAVTADEPNARALRGDGVGYHDVTGHAAQVRAAARQQTGSLGYAIYARLRAQAVAVGFAASLAAELAFPAESNRANFMTAAFCAWSRRQSAWQAAEPGALEAELGAVDVPFRLRRAEFVLQGINEQFAAAGPEGRGQLAAMKSAVWDLITGLRGLVQQVAAGVRDQAAELFGRRRSPGRAAWPTRRRSRAPGQAAGAPS